MIPQFQGNLLTLREVEKLRLMLSTYQDGSGQLATTNGLTLPGWRDFERAVALVFNGQAQESKAIFDVFVPNGHSFYGISCKMRRTLSVTKKTGRVTLELSNSSGKFWDALKSHGLTEDSYANAPDRAGKLLIELMEQWHEEVVLSHDIDLAQCYYLLLQWDGKDGHYQLYQYSINLPNPSTLLWYVKGRRLVGEDDLGVIFEWYGFSGGQLKYYPFVHHAAWVSEIFQLEPLPLDELGYGLHRKVVDYFPQLWQKTNQ